MRARQRNLKRGCTALLGLAYLLVVPSVACGTGVGKLTRKKAELLIRSQWAPTVETKSISARYQKLNGEYFYFEEPRPVDAADFGEIKFLLGHSKIYAKALVVETDTSGWSPYSKYSLVELTPTDEGRQYVVGTTEGWLEVRISQSVFGEVTGIVFNDQQTFAVVEYSVKHDWTPFGLFYRLREPAKYPDVVTTKAALQKYDDGWRIMK